VKWYFPASSLAAGIFDTAEDDRSRACGHRRSICEKGLNPFFFRIRTDMEPAILAFQTSLMINTCILRTQGTVW
jgi:hypothetical protein